MTYEEALEVFGLSRKPSIKMLKILRNAAIKQATTQNNVERQIAINAAWAILSGKEKETQKAEPAQEPKVADEKLSGTVKAKCSHRGGSEFVLDWTMFPFGAGMTTDRVIINNPQRLEWDTNLNGFARINALGARAPFFDSEALHPSGHGPAGRRAGSWTSGFVAQIEFDRVYCPVCRAPNLQWCQHCHTIFCHKNRQDYPSSEYHCPNCRAVYGWYEAGTAEPIQTRFDGKQLRSLMDQKPVSLPRQSNQKLLKRR